MTICINGNSPNPSYVVVNNTNAARVNLVIPASGVNVLWPIWPKSSAAGFDGGPEFMSVVRLQSSKADVYLRNLTFQEAYIEITPNGYKTHYEYSAEGSSYDLSWERYEYAGMAYQDGSLYFVQSLGGASGSSLSASGIPNDFDYDSISVGIETNVSPNLKSDIIDGRSPASGSSASSSFPTLYSSVILKRFTFEKTGDHTGLTFDTSGSWTSPTSYTYRYNGVYTYVDTYRTLFQLSRPVVVDFWKNHNL